MVRRGRPHPRLRCCLFDAPTLPSAVPVGADRVTLCVTVAAPGTAAHVQRTEPRSLDRFDFDQLVIFHDCRVVLCVTHSAGLGLAHGMPFCVLRHDHSVHVACPSAGLRVVLADARRPGVARLTAVSALSFCHVRPLRSVKKRPAFTAGRFAYLPLCVLASTRMTATTDTRTHPVTC
jgi:hypothetical protein